MDDLHMHADLEYIYQKNLLVKCKLCPAVNACISINERAIDNLKRKSKTVREEGTNSPNAEDTMQSSANIHADKAKKNQ